jgi:hypothetical protein
VLYTALVRPRLEYAFVVWNSFTAIDSKSKSKNLCVYFARLFPCLPDSYNFALTKLNLPSLCTRRHHLDALFFIQAFRGLKFCHSLLEMVYLRVPPRDVWDFSAFRVCPSNKHCPSARCANAAYIIIVPTLCCVCNWPCSC